jgi:hypothetical protein
VVGLGGGDPTAAPDVRFRTLAFIYRPFAERGTRHHPAPDLPLNLFVFPFINC